MGTKTATDSKLAQILPKRENLGGRPGDPQVARPAAAHIVPHHALFPGPSRGDTMRHMADTVFLRHLSRWQAEQQREAFADLYVEAYGGGPGGAGGPAGSRGSGGSCGSGGEFQDRQDFLLRFADYVQHPGFDMMIASEAGTVVGCVCGFRTDRGDSSWPGHEDLTSAAGQVFTVVEVMVLPSHRRRRVATRLLEQLLARAGSALAT